MMAVSTVRSATPEDLRRARRLLEKNSGRHIDRSLLVPVTGRRHVLVLDAPSGDLAAVAIVAIDRPSAHLEALAMEPRYANRDIETRMHAVAEALADAFECQSLDVPGAPTAWSRCG